MPRRGEQFTRYRERAAAILAAGEKRCPQCRQVRCLNAYARSSRYLDGRQPVCRRCKRGYHVRQMRGVTRSPRPYAVPEWPPGYVEPPRKPSAVKRQREVAMRRAA